MSQHTPGPWVVCGRYSNGYETCPEVWAGADGRARWVATTIGILDHRPEILANAHLIAAAPDLLAACEEALDWVPDHHAAGAKARKLIEDAIDKAKGVSCAGS